ncbi:MAG: RDD family protein [Oligoflexales bacterium]
MNYQDQNQKARLKHAVFWQKVFAFLVDALILAACIVLISSHFNIEPSEKNLFILYILLRSFYFTCFLTFLQKTPGGMAIGIKVCNGSGGKIGFDQACIRSLVSILSILLAGFGYLIAAFNDESQTLHDQLAKTHVITKRDGSNFKGFLYSVFFVVSVILFYNSLQVAGTVVGTVGQINYSGNGKQTSPERLGRIINPKWVTAREKIKKRSLKKHKVYKSLKVNRFNRMANKLKKMQKRSHDDDFKKLKFERIIHLRSQKILQVGTLNNLFYQTLDFEVLDSQGKKLKQTSRNFYNETIIRSYMLPEIYTHKAYKLKILFPRNYVIVYFSKNDQINAAYKFRKGSIIQLKQRSDETYNFAIKSSKREFKNLNFVAFNFASKIIGLNPKVEILDNFHKVSLNSNRESIALADC